MATVGFKSAKVAVLDENEKTTASDIFSIDAQTGGAIEAAISGLAAAQNKVYASNIPYYVSSKGTGDVKIALTVADLESLPPGALDKILGRGKNADNIITVGQDTEAPYCAIGVYTEDKNGKNLFIGLLKVKFSFDGDDVKSTDNNGSVLSQDVLNGSGVSRASDGLSWAKAREADGVTQATFENFIFPLASTTPVTGVVLTPATADLTVGGTQQLTAAVSPANATDPSVSYSSSDPSIATVDSNGLVTGVATGNATITATTTDGGFTDVCDVTVS